MREDYTAIAMIIDRSGSMNGIVDDTIGGVNTFIEKQKEVDGDASVLMVQFDDKIETIHDFIDIQEVPELTSDVYYPRNSTSLLDAIGMTCTKLGKILSDLDESERPGKVIVAILTDGQENTSMEFNASQIKDMIKEQEEVYNWDFNFISADISSLDDARSWGFSVDKSALYSKASTGGTFDALSAKMTRVRGSSMEQYASGEVQDFTSDELLAMNNDKDDT